MGRPHLLRQRSIAAVAAIATVTLVAACGSSGGGSNDNAGGNSGGGALHLTVGWVNDESGPLSGLGGIEETNAAKLAVKDINAAKGKVTVELKTEDSQSTTAAAISGTQRLLQGGDVDVMSGYAFTQNGQAATPLLVQSKLPTLFISVTALANRNDRIFSMDTPNGVLQGFMAEKYLVPQGVKTLGIIWQEQPTLADNRQKLVDAAQANGIKVVADQSAALTTTDLSSQVAAVLAAKPDAVFLDLLAGQAATTLASLRSGGYTGKIVSQLGVVLPILPKTAGDAVNGLVVPSFWTPGVDNDISSRFVSEYAKEYPDQPAPNLFGMMAYDAIWVLAKAAEEAGSTDADAIAKQLASGTFDTGMNPKLTFDSNGFGTLSPLLIEYKNGEPTLFSGS